MCHNRRKRRTELDCDKEVASCIVSGRSDVDAEEEFEEDSRYINYLCFGMVYCSF